MTPKQKAMAVTAVIFAAILAWVFLRGNSKAAGNFKGPEYLTYNIPASRNLTGAANGLPQVTETYSSCGCSGTNAQMFTGVQQMLNTYESQVGGILSEYVDNIKNYLRGQMGDYISI